MRAVLKMRSSPAILRAQIVKIKTFSKLREVLFSGLYIKVRHLIRDHRARPAQNAFPAGHPAHKRSRSGAFRLWLESFCDPSEKCFGNSCFRDVTRSIEEYISNFWGRKFAINNRQERLKREHSGQLHRASCRFLGSTPSLLSLRH